MYSRYVCVLVRVQGTKNETLAPQDQQQQEAAETNKASSKSDDDDHDTFHDMFVH